MPTRRQTHLVLSGVIHRARRVVELATATLVRAAVDDALGERAVEVVIVVGVIDAPADGEHRAVRGGDVVAEGVELGSAFVGEAAVGGAFAQVRLARVGLDARNLAVVFLEGALAASARHESAGAAE